MKSYVTLLPRLSAGENHFLGGGAQEKGCNLLMGQQQLLSRGILERESNFKPFLGFNFQGRTDQEKFCRRSISRCGQMTSSFFYNSMVGPDIKMCVCGRRLLKVFLLSHLLKMQWLKKILSLFPVPYP